MFELTPREALESVILIQTNQGLIGSAVVFKHQGETLVATAAHVLGKGRTTEVKVYEQGRFTERRGAVLHKTGDGPEESDIAVLQLLPEPSGGSGWATGTANAGIAHAVPGRPAQVLGFPGGRWASQRQEDTGGLIPTALVQGGVVGGTETNGRPRRLYIGAQLFPGFSGGAVITEGADGKANLAAIVTRVMNLNSDGWDGKYAGFGQGTAFDDVIELIEGDPAGLDRLVWAEEIGEENGSREEGGSGKDEETTSRRTNEDKRGGNTGRKGKNRRKTDAQRKACGPAPRRMGNTETRRRPGELGPQKASGCGGSCPGNPEERRRRRADHARKRRTDA